MYPCRTGRHYLSCLRLILRQSRISLCTITILSWELTSLDTHVRAIIETIRNDSLRKLWNEQLNAELEYYDKYLKYGKMKGWTRVVPIYGELVTYAMLNAKLFMDVLYFLVYLYSFP